MRRYAPVKWQRECGAIPASQYIGRGTRKQERAHNGPLQTTPESSSDYDVGLGVLAVLGGRIGYSTRGCSPVRVCRKAVMALTSSSFSSCPNWLLPIMATAWRRSQTSPLWK